jgi:hypothetical protein
MELGDDLGAMCAAMFCILADDSHAWGKLVKTS